MKLPSFGFLKNKQEEKENYLGIFLKEDSGVVFFLESGGNKLVRLSEEKFKFTNGWDNLVEDIDEVLYRLELKLKKSPDKTIFFLYSHLVDQNSGQIRPEYLKKIKDISKSLELKPMGYIECHEAVVNFIHKKESISLNALMVEFDKSALEIFLYKNGKLEYEETISRSSNLVDDLVPAFERARQKSMLPTRLILYNSRDLDLEVTKILSYKWDTSHFVQLPRTEVVKEEDLFESLIDVFETQLFSKKDQAPTPPEEKEVMGFVIGGDVKKEETSVSTSSISEPSIQQRKFQLSMPAFVESFLPRIQSFFSNLTNRVRSLNLPFKPLLPIIGGVAIVLLILATELLFHKAEITIFLPSQSIKSDLTLVVPEKEVQKKTASTIIKTEKSTTGKRDVGEKAKGTVTIHNFDDKEVIFREGTAIQTGGVRFILDNDVKVASSSLATDGSAKLPGKGQAKVTAEEIGTEGNVAANKRFDIEDQAPTTYFAINDASFTGGSKKQVKTVAKADIDSLNKKALEDATSYQTKELVPKLGGKSELLKQLNDIKLASPNFSHEIGEESDKLTLEAKANITYYVLSKDSLLKEFSQNLDDKVQKGYTIKKEEIVYKIGDVEQDDESYTIETTVAAKASQDIKNAELLKKIAGRNSDKVEEIIRSEYKSKIDFEITNPLPFLKSRFPFRKGSIDLEISYL